jgi:quercetin dioxygenase-like cupin family protein
MQDMFHFLMAQAQTRRNFLATAAALPLAATFIPAAEGQAAPAGPAFPFHLFSAQTLDEAWKGLHAKPDNKYLINDPKLLAQVIMTVEEKKAAKEFEYHANRDHVIYILEGATTYHVGGTPTGSHKTKEGEWLAPESEGFTTYNLKKGDMLLAPRMTPHRRITDQSVTILLFSALLPA